MGKPTCSTLITEGTKEAACAFASGICPIACGTCARTTTTTRTPQVCEGESDLQLCLNYDFEDCSASTDIAPILRKSCVAMCGLCGVTTTTTTSTTTTTTSTTTTTTTEKLCNGERDDVGKCTDVATFCGVVDDITFGCPVLCDTCGQSAPTTTTTTTTVDPALLCNGVPDDPVTCTGVAAFCGLFDGITNGCPVLCGTCDR